MIEVKVGSAVTVVNGIALGKGAAMGIDIDQKVRISPDQDLSIRTNDPTIGDELVKSCVDLFSEVQEIVIDNVAIEIDMVLPPSKGLKTSSAVSYGVLSGLNSFYDTDLSQIDLINLSAEASIKAGVSITGAIDDAWASAAGGFVVTNNIDRELLVSHNLSLSKDVILLIPQQSNPKSELEIEFDHLDKYVLRKAFREALDGDWKHAIQRNSRVYAQYYLEDWDTINEIEDQLSGVVGLNGAGPSLFVLCDSDNTQQNLTTLRENFSDYDIIQTILR